MKSIVLFVLAGLLLTGNVSSENKNNDYSIFIDAIKLELDRIGISTYEDHFKDEYFIALMENEYFEKGSQIGLSNLYSTCTQQEKNEWAGIIHQHFVQIKNIRIEEKLVLPKLDSFTTAQEYLKIRLYPLEYSEQIRQKSIVDTRYDEFISVVVINLPGSVKNLSNEYLTKWSMSGKEVFNSALVNTIKDNNEQFTTHYLTDKSPIYMLTSDENIFITTSLFDLKSKNINIGSIGALVAVPNRLGIVYIPLEKTTFNVSIFQLLNLTNYMYNAGPGSITNTIFWYDGKDIFPIKHNTLKKSIQLPIELVNRLR